MPSPLDPRDSKIIGWIRDRQSAEERRFDTDAAWTRFQSTHSSRASTRSAPSWNSSLVWRIAAVLVIAVGGALYWRSRAASTNSANATMVERVAALGQRTTFTLDDGTRITLNGGSRLRYPAAGARLDRDVYLDGEGLFEVRHDPRRTFRVHAGRGTVEDLGTRFTVRAYSERPEVDVVVTEGSVALRRDSSSAPALRLNAGEGATLGESGEIRRMDAAVFDRYVGWTTGSLVFDNIPLRDAASELERWYGVHIVVDSSLAAHPVAARFHGETITQALDAITLALDARYTRKDSAYTITPRIR